VVRSAALLALLVIVAGCADGGPRPLPTGRISAYFPVGGVADTIDIVAVDRLPLRAAELVAPDGRTTAAVSIAARPAPSSGAALTLPTNSFSGVSALAAIGGDQLGPPAVGAAVQSRSRLLATLSNATIILPDPVAYRRDWRKYRIRLRFGDPPDADSREIAAPVPAPGL
jgi:hypothetical protein